MRHYDDRRVIKHLKYGNEYPMLQETLFTEERNDASRGDGLPGVGDDDDSQCFNWQCVSFIRRNGTSLDFRVSNENDIMVLINVVQ